MKQNYLKSVVSVALVTASSTVLANGLALNEQSASTAGTAHAGRASAAIDASTIYGNPAGMSRLDRAQVTVGGAYIMADSEVSGVRGGAPGEAEDDFVPPSFVPFGYYVQPLSDKIAVGVGLYVPFGVTSKYEDDFKGRTHGLHSEVKVITLQPTISYQLTDRIAIGAGITFNRIEGKLTSAPRPLPGLELNADLEGDDNTLGYNVGLLVAITDNLDWGITYHSKTDFELEGDIELSSGPASLNGTYDASLGITMPESVDTSLTYELNRWTLHAGVTWTRWSRLEKLDIKVPSSSALATRADQELNWEDTWAYSVGAAYQLNSEWKLRGGVAIDKSPTNDQYRTVRIPVSDRQIFTVGAAWSPTPDWTIDMAYGYLAEDKGEVTQGKGTSNYYHAEYDNFAHILTASATYRF